MKFPHFYSPEGKTLFANALTAAAVFHYTFPDLDGFNFSHHVRSKKHKLIKEGGET
jgi:hypothetical protein